MMPDNVGTTCGVQGNPLCFCSPNNIRSSIGFKSGEYGGQSVVSISSSSHIIATWSLGLLCSRRNPMMLKGSADPFTSLMMWSGWAWPHLRQVICRVLVVLILFLLAQKNRYCWWLRTFYGPVQLYQSDCLLESPWCSWDFTANVLVSPLGASRDNDLSQSKTNDKTDRKDEEGKMLVPSTCKTIPAPALLTERFNYFFE